MTSTGARYDFRSGRPFPEGSTGRPFTLAVILSGEKNPRRFSSQRTKEEPVERESDKEGGNRDRERGAHTTAEG